MKRLITIAIFICAFFSINVNAQWIRKLLEFPRSFRVEPTPKPFRFDVIQYNEARRAIELTKKIEEAERQRLWRQELKRLELERRPFILRHKKNIEEWRSLTKEILRPDTNNGSQSLQFSDDFTEQNGQPPFTELFDPDLGEMQSVSYRVASLDNHIVEEMNGKQDHASSREMTNGENFSERKVFFIKKINPESFLHRNKYIDQGQQTKEKVVPPHKETNNESQSHQSYDEISAQKNGTNNISVPISAPINDSDWWLEYIENEIKEVMFKLNINIPFNEEGDVNQTFIFYIILQDEYALAA